MTTPKGADPSLECGTYRFLLPEYEGSIGTRTDERSEEAGLKPILPEYEGLEPVSRMLHTNDTR